MRYGAYVFGACYVALSFYLSGCSQHTVSQTNTNHSHAPKVANIANQPLFSMSPQSGVQQLNCQAVTQGQSIRLKKSTVFSKGCQLPLNVTFTIANSDIAVDCQDVQLISGEGYKRSAFTIVSDKPINNISISNCHVTGYGHALHVRQRTSPRVRYLRGEKNPDALRKKSPQHIHIKNLTSDKSINSAIFIGDHVHHVTMENMKVGNAGTVGVYFEFGSRQNVVKNSTFTGNGHRRFKPDREAIAIDSSQYNRIEGNTFSGNGAGAVFLYRNCFEHAADTSKGNHFLRTESSDHNDILNNRISDEEVGVWVASRQSRDLSGFKCGAYKMKQTLFATYHEDAAEKNNIQNNQFYDVARAVVVEDDNNTVANNVFTDVERPAVIVGSTVRASTSIGEVKRVGVFDNQFLGCESCEVGDFIQYRASQPSRQCGNTANTSGEVACQAK